MTMVDIQAGESVEAGEPVRGSRVDMVMAAAIVLTVDAVLLLAVAVLGVPFLMFAFGDVDGTWQRLWPLTVAWVVAVGLALVCAAAVAGLSGFGSYSVRRVSTGAALGVAVVAVVLATGSIGSTPGWLLLGLPFAVANLAAALVLAGPDRAVALTDRFPLFRPAAAAGRAPEPIEEPAYEQDEAAYARPEADESHPSRTHDTIDLLAFYGRPGRADSRAAPRRPRGPAALRTLTGVRLPPRARRPRR
ncbi:hypothetical protein [Actinoplanes sp. M2I2]|uniref:hypothetical protein n=1 Tax=Actinoplanes sp. M2I2 TaxID=1734444 RepID=UPI002021A2D3|nr:hypothetical protein [Actinoplanes sp. M2I2]